MEKEALAGEIQEGETAEVLRESSAHRRWVALCWLLTWWIPSPCLTYVGRIKSMDVRQAWQEKLVLALNLLIWFICGCAVFIFAVLGVLICPTEHVFNTSELTSHSITSSLTNTQHGFSSSNNLVLLYSSSGLTHYVYAAPKQYLTNTIGLILDEQ